MIKLNKIHKIYTQGKIGFHALKDVSLFFKQDERVVVYGKSGCGKTTLLNLIAGLDRPSSGDMVISDKLTTKFTESEWDYFRNHNIGFIFQQFNLIEHLPVIENVAISAKISGHRHNNARKMALEMLKKVGLEKHALKKPRQLSGGERQRVGIARALINNPDIILADEPTGALDRTTGNQIMDLITEMAKDKLLIIVTHDMKLAQKYATRLIELQDGVVTKDTAPDMDKVTIRLKRDIHKRSLSFIEGIRLALHNIKARKWRTGLVAFGLSIGIVGLLLISALFNTIRDSMHAEGAALRDNPELSIYRPFDPDQDAHDMLSAIEDNHPFFLDLSYVPDYPLTIIENETSGTVYRNPVSLGHYIGTPVHPDILRIYDSFVGDGRLPETSDEFVLPLSKAQALFSTHIDLSHDELWNRLNHHQFSLSTNFHYAPFELENEFEPCLKVENWDEDPDTLPQSFTDRFGDYETHMETLTPYTDEPVKIYDHEQKHLFCDDYSSLNWFIDRDNHKEVTTLRLVGIIDDRNINNALFHPDFLLTLEIQKTALSNDQNIDNENREKVIAYIGNDHIDQKAAIIRSLENEGYMVQETTNVSFNFLAGLTLLFTYIIQFIFSSIIGIAVITAGLMLLMVLYISIIERTREIGLIRAMGGTRKDIRTIFVGETTMIGLFAGLLSIGIALILVLLGNHVFNQQLHVLLSRYFENIPVDGIFSLDIRIMLYAVIGSIIIAITSGLIPAASASRKQPIEALKKD